MPMKTIGFVKAQINDSLPVIEDTNSVFSTIISNLNTIKNNLLSIKANLFSIGDSLSSCQLTNKESTKLRELSENMSVEYIEDMLASIESHNETVMEIHSILETKLQDLKGYDSSASEEDVEGFE